MSWLEQKYVNQLATKLERFKRKGKVVTFRCPLCGDSQKTKSKTRGYIYPKKGRYVFFCHNCSESMVFGKFLKRIDESLYYEYVKEWLIENKDQQYQEPEVKSPVPLFKAPIFDLPKISQLDHNHFCKTYVVGRKIPNPYHAKLYYAAKFKAFVNSLIPKKIDDRVPEEPRLVIPFLDQNGKVFGFQGRSLLNKPSGGNSADFRYMTIILDEDKPKMFGLDTVDFNKTYYVLEGPIDSMFLDNALASAGGTLITDLETVGGNKDNAVVVYDNEPRNKEVLTNIGKTIAAGFKVCIWPEDVAAKDVNDLILAGYTGAEVQALIDQNTVSGLAAQLRFTAWRKI